jgi:7-cyano-7-deazaguanine reductase|nr:NADPH-dependent 7-cyano-7-deazaguanine reductase QueF [Deltaproteobacteria bacterium]
MKYGEKKIKRAELEPWPNPYPERDYTIEVSFPEFTCLCPKSGYPDFATIKIIYVPDRFIVELKSLKLYLNDYRDRYMSHEEATNKIFSDLMKTLSPRIIKLEGDFHPRGNVHTVIKVEGGSNAGETRDGTLSSIGFDQRQ